MSDLIKTEREWVFFGVIVILCILLAKSHYESSLEATVVLDNMPHETELKPKLVENRSESTEGNNTKDIDESLAKEQLAEKENIITLSENNLEMVLLRVPKKDLPKLGRIASHAEWQIAYDKAEYDPLYDLTWKDDMYTRIHDLVLSEERFNKITVDGFECEDEKCEVSFSQMGGSPAIVSDLIWKLKDHPAILLSGKKRNILVRSISFSEGRIINEVVIE